MGQIEDLRLFVIVVDQGSISRAADVLNIAKSAVSRRLGQLEDRYGVRLIDRQPGTWSVTSAGQELYQRAIGIVSDAEDLDTDFIHASASLKGPLRVSIAREFGMSFLNPTILSFVRSHAEVSLSVDFDDRLVDLENENYDLAVRITSKHSDAQGEVQLGTTRHGMFASPAYVKANGAPLKPNQLKEHALLHYGAERRASWSFGFAGKKTSIEFQPALNSNSGEFLLQAALDGFGIIRLPDFIVADAVADKSLVHILPESEFPAFGIRLIHAPNHRMNKRMRAFSAAVQQSCGSLSQHAGDEMLRPMMPTGRA